MKWAVVALLATVALGETRAERGERVVKEALAALGGENFLSMRDRVEFGRAYSFYRERLSGLSKTRIYSRYLTRPEPPVPAFIGLRLRQALGKDEEVAVVYLEDEKGWDITYRGAKPIAADHVKRFHDGLLRNVFYILRMRLGEPGLIIESNGTDVVDNSPVESVDITDSDNRVVTVWFHQSTKFPVRQRTIRRLAGDRDEDVINFSNYRDVGNGIHWPYAWLQTRNGEKIFEMFAESVAVNESLDDSLFTISADTKILKKK